MCSNYTEHKIIDDWWGQKKDVYFLVPFIKPSKTKLQLGREGEQLIVNSPYSKDEKLYVNVINLPEKTSLSEIAVMLPAFSRIYKELEKEKGVGKTYKKRIQTLNNEVEAKWNEGQGLRDILHLNPLIGFKNPLVPIDKKSILGLAVFALVLGYMSEKLPENFQPMAGIPSELLLLLFLGLIFFIVMSLEKKPKQHADLASAEFSAMR